MRRVNVCDTPGRRSVISCARALIRHMEEFDAGLVRQHCAGEVSGGSPGRFGSV